MPSTINPNQIHQPHLDLQFKTILKNSEAGEECLVRKLFAAPGPFLPPWLFFGGVLLLLHSASWSMPKWTWPTEQVFLFWFQQQKRNKNRGTCLHFMAIKMKQWLPQRRQWSSNLFLMSVCQDGHGWHKIHKTMGSLESEWGCPGV